MKYVDKKSGEIPKMRKLNYDAHVEVLRCGRWNTDCNADVELLTPMANWRKIIQTNSNVPALGSGMNLIDTWYLKQTQTILSRYLNEFKRSSFEISNNSFLDLNQMQTILPWHPDPPVDTYKI